MDKMMLEKSGWLTTPRVRLFRPQYTKGVKLKPKLKDICTNARSLANKIDKLEVKLAQEGFDFVGIIESWLNDSHN